MGVRCLLCSIICTLVSIPTIAQSVSDIRVISLKAPQFFKIRYGTDESNVTVLYQGNISPAKHYYLRVFLGTKDDLVRLASHVRKNQCAQLRSFWRVAATYDQHNVLLDPILKISSSKQNQDYVVVFEEGGDEPRESKILKLPKEDLSKYLDSSISLMVYWSPKDQLLHANMSRPGWLVAMAPIVHAQERPQEVPPSEPMISEVPCKSVTLNNRFPLLPEASQMTKVNIEHDKTLSQLVGIELRSHVCGGQ